MLNKLKGQPLWYQLWAISVALSAIYCLGIWLTGTLSSFDRFLQLFVFGSIVVDFLLFPGKRA